MNKLIDKKEFDQINQKITDRTNVFYWQTDRAVTPQQAGQIWADRHRYFTADELIKKANEVLENNSVVSIEPLDPNAQTNLGNVNSVRIAHLASGQEVVIRSHPKGIKNDYFHAEALAASYAKDNGVPSYTTLAIHDFEGKDDFAFHITERLPGTAISKWLETHPEDESRLLIAVGKVLAGIHQLRVKGFGPFDNEKAKTGKLIGLHGSYVGAIRAGLTFNLKVLQKEEILTPAQAASIDKLLQADNYRLKCDNPVLIHNDFADWNLLTDGKDVTGVLDWDECVGGDYVSDIACWSTFFDPDRLEGMLKGYFANREKPADFEEKFQLLRLRYTISKMTLRVRRYIWEPSESIKKKIIIGKNHLTKSLEHFKT
ncbi:aminoglycoside phosphotransferase family protein [Candidatus Roizmanbacteria bacterium]|nr:aminoglycoside phosphotransferase family protein [Candidatus Roizmanbacteria bacterium]